MITKKIKTQECFYDNEKIKKDIKPTCKKSVTSLKAQKLNPENKRLTQHRKTQYKIAAIGSPENSLNYVHKNLIGKSKSKINKISSKWKSEVDSSVDGTIKYESRSIELTQSSNKQCISKQTYNQLLRRSKDILSRYEKQFIKYKQQNQKLKQQNNYYKNLYRSQ